MLGRRLTYVRLAASHLLRSRENMLKQPACTSWAAFSFVQLHAGVLARLACWRGGARRSAFRRGTFVFILNSFSNKYRIRAIWWKCIIINCNDPRKHDFNCFCLLSLFVWRLSNFVCLLGLGFVGLLSIVLLCLTSLLCFVRSRQCWFRLVLPGRVSARASSIHPKRWTPLLRHEVFVWKNYRLNT